MDDFEADLASQLTGSPKSKKSKKKPQQEKYQLDDAILDEVAEGVDKLRFKILEKYYDGISSFTSFVLLAILVGLGYTAYKVNKMLSKAHMF